MPWSITIGRIAGTAVRIHITFILFLVWIGASALRHDGGDGSPRLHKLLILQPLKSRHAPATSKPMA